VEWKSAVPAENPGQNQHPDYKAEIAQLIRSNLAPRLMAERLLDYHENDVAAALELLKKEERSRLYAVLDTDALARILEYADDLNACIRELSGKKRAAVLSRLEPATVSEYLRELDKNERGLVLGLMEESARSEVLLLSSFDEDAVGGRMSTNFVSIPAGLSVRQAMRELVRQAAENDNISTLYVVEEDGTFLGAIDLKDLIIAREGTALEEIVVSSYPYVYADEAVDDCIERLRGYSEDAIPVLDEENRLVGVLTAQDITELVGDSLVEDYAKLAGLTAEEDLNEPLRKSIGKRLPWLIVLLGLGLIVSGVVGLFEQVAASLTVVVCFQSLILAMAGNVGTQSLAVAIRVLAEEELTGRQKLRLVVKEARVGFCNGLLLGILSVGFIGLYLMLGKGEPAQLAFSVSLCTGAAMFLAMLLSGLTGTTVPLLFRRLGVDPAVASGPLITTVNDLVAVVIYYSLVWFLLLGVLGL